MDARRTNCREAETLTSLVRKGGTSRPLDGALPLAARPAFRIELQKHPHPAIVLERKESPVGLLIAPGLMLKVGDQAPNFTATLDDDTSFTLSAQRGKVIVLFFYPKDDTPG